MIDDEKRVSPAKIEWTANRVPKAVQFDDVYYSDLDGLAESDYVFVQPNQLPQRFAALLAGQKFTVAETGFGTGLNFLQTLRVWFDNAPQSSELCFISFEKHPLSVFDLKKAHSAFAELQPFSQALCQVYPSCLPGWHEMLLFDGKVRLILWFGDVLEGLPQFECYVDAWFLDGFAPSKNPEMWRPALFTQMARLSHAQTTFATFSVANMVRQGLQKAGFTVQKAPGFGLKRERCYGHMVQMRSFTPKQPWYVSPTSVAIPKQHAVVIGAGLAGAAVAYQLAQQGWTVQVFEASDQSAQQASGNLAGAIHPLVTADWNLRSQFYLRGFEATLKWLLPWLGAQEIVGELNGLMQLAMTEQMENRLKDSLQRVGLPPDFAVWCEAEQASERIGHATDFSGLFFPKGGWVRPSTVVTKCLAHPNIELRLSEPVLDWERSDQAWSVSTDQAQYQAQILVVATGGLDERLNQKLGLPIRPVKGQVSHLTATEIQGPLQCTVTHRGYTVTGAFGEGAPYAGISGATFEAPDRTTDLSAVAQAENRTMLEEALPDWLQQTAMLEKKAPCGKVGFRPTTPDHLPLIGAVPDPEWMQRVYLSQSHTQASYRYSPQQYQPGLYVSNGHGARGLMSVFLGAEIIGQMVSGSSPVMPQNLYHAVHPARFAIRAWHRDKKSP